jgi:cytoskeletal protein CcmA (bactofilin family)
MFGPAAKTKPTTSPAPKTLARAEAKLGELEQAARPSAPAPKTESQAQTGTVIAAGTVITGNISAEGDVRVDGTVKGDVSTKAHLVVGSQASVEGNLASEHAEIAGKVTGTIKAGMVTIRSTSAIVGDVITKDLNVEAGSAFNGRFQVGAQG